MADEKKGTIYQQLNKMLNLDGFQDQPQIILPNNNNKIIIKGNSPEEIYKKGLELEQKRELQNKFFRTTDRGFQKALQYEAARLPAYIDYEGMEYYPIISSALDLFMEETTTIGLNGKMLNIYSNKERVKSLLEDFFYDTLNVNVNLPFWTRNLVKYGDNFVLLYGERKKGITHVKQLVNYEIERIERIKDGKPIIRFKERQTGDEFNVFEIAHFRLLGDDKYLPYGSSVLNKVRRVFRQLVMAEDAMLTYRIIRAGEKKVFKIDVGNIDEDDIEDYIYKVATKFKKVAQVAPNNGQIDYRFNILGNDEDYFLPVRNANTQTGIETLPGACLSLNTKIELLDGRSLELKEIINEFNDGKELWSYSINPNTGLIVPGKITWAGITRKNTEVLKITLDNGETIISTPDHKFPTKYNGKKEAKELVVGESMWAFNKKFEKIKNQGNEYEMIYDHSINDWIYTHRMVCNKPENKIKYSENSKNLWKSEEYRKKISEKQTIKYSKILLDLLVDYYKLHKRLDLILNNIINVDNSEWLNEFWRINNGNLQLNKMSKITNNNIDKLLKNYNYKNWSDFKKKINCYNHKIVNIEYLTEKQDTGTITIDGNEDFHNYHTFALSSGIFTYNSNLDQIADIEYLRDNLFIGLGVPKPFLSFQDAAGGGKNLAQYDIRFAKKINRIQQALVQELNKMAMIHLYLLGYSGEDLNSFSITLTNPSTQAEQLKTELFREKAQTYTELTRGENGIAAMSHTNAKRMIFNMSDREIVDDLKQQKMEKVVMQELADSPVTIKKSGLFKDIDQKFGAPEETMLSSSGGTEAGGVPSEPMSGGMPSAPMEGAPTAGGMPSTPMGGGAEAAGVPPPTSVAPTAMEENKFNDHVEEMIFGGNSEKKQVKKTNKKIITENTLINEKLNKNAEMMIKEIDELMKNGESINNEQKNIIVEDIDIENIEGIDLT